MFVDFSKTFDSIPRGKMEQILLAFGLPKEFVITIMMLYNNMKVMVPLPNGNTDVFEIEIHWHYICVNYVLQTSKTLHTSTLCGH